MIKDQMIRKQRLANFAVNFLEKDKSAGPPLSLTCHPMTCLTCSQNREHPAKIIKDTAMSFKNVER